MAGVAVLVALATGAWDAWPDSSAGHAASQAEPITLPAPKTTASMPLETAISGRRSQRTDQMPLYILSVGRHSRSRLRSPIARLPEGQDPCVIGLFAGTMRA